MLTAFYQQKDPSKLASIDKFLAKYAGQEDQLFRNLAKKYNIDPSMFGVSAAAPAPAAGGFGAATSPGGFGQHSTLGGGSLFGSPPAAAPSAGGFGQASAVVVVHRALAPQLAGVDSGRSPNLAAAEVSVLLLHQRREALVDSVLQRRHLEPSAAPSAPLGASYSIDKSNNKIQNRLCNQMPRYCT